MTGTALTLYGKQDKTRTVEISDRLAEAIDARRKCLGAKPSDLIFPNRDGNPDQHLLRRLRTLAGRACAKFAVELHKLSKTGASLLLELGHESLATTQKYLADVRKPGEAKRAAADADFIPRPSIAKTGTHGD